MLRDMTQRYPNLTYTPVLSNAMPLDEWQGRTGWVHEAAFADHPQLAQYDVYASGPPVMVEAVRHHFSEQGLPADQLFFDSFDFAPDALEKLRQKPGQ
jgi:CDP-4-dehydro-6-deoxyglucose reductase